MYMGERESNEMCQHLKDLRKSMNGFLKDQCTILQTHEWVKYPYKEQAR